MSVFPSPLKSPTLTSAQVIVPHVVHSVVLKLLAPVLNLLPLEPV